MNFPANEFGDLETGVHKGMISVSVGAKTYRMSVKIRVKDGSLETIILEHEGKGEIFVNTGDSHEPY